MIENIGVSLIFLGIVLLFLGVIALVVGKNKSKVEAGGVVFIGPFPVFFGATNTNVALILIVASIVFIFITILIAGGIVK